MEPGSFSAALKRVWPVAILLFVAAIFGSSIYAQKRIMPTAQASVAVRDPLTINPAQYHNAEVSFDSIVKSDQLAVNVGKVLGYPVKGKLSVSVQLPATGINLSPLYVVRAQDPDPARAMTIVNTAVTEARKLYGQLNGVKSSEVAASIAPQKAAADAALATATKAYNDFAAQYGGDPAAAVTAARDQVTALNSQLAQAQVDLSSARGISGAAASAAQDRVDAYQAQLINATKQLQPLAAAQPEFQQLTVNLTQARNNEQQLAALQQQLVVSQIVSISDQVKTLDTASMASKTLLKILVYMLGVIVGLLAALTAVYVQAARQRRKETAAEVVGALGVPALVHIPRRVVV